MGASNSRMEEDKGLQLCRSRKKFIKQALNGRCSLAAAHIAYIQQLKITGAALRRFVDPQPQALVESSAIRSSPSAPLSPSKPYIVTAANVYQSHPMRLIGTLSKKVEEKPSVPVVVSVASTAPPSTGEAPELSSFQKPPDPLDGHPPWDYFGLFHHMEDHFSEQERRAFDQVSDHSDAMRRVREEEGIPDLEDAEKRLSSPGIDLSQESEDEFDEPSSASLVRSFTNVNATEEGVVKGDSPIRSSGQSSSQTKFSSSDDVNEGSTVNPSESVTSEARFANGKKNSTCESSPITAESSGFAHSNGAKISANGESEDKVAPNDFFSSISDIEQLFVRASESGKEVPRMLEANKFHFRPVSCGKERGSIAWTLLKSFFSCGKDPNEIKQEPSQNSVKYLTWHRTTSFRSASSRNLLLTNPTNETDDANNNLFDNFCMVSGSHASTLDRLYAWEKKLYDEVKAGQVLKSKFDQKCKLLRQKESRGQNADKIRAAAKDLHSRIRVAIHRIYSISKRIEDIRDLELQPQLEELIEGLRTMWKTMLECHKLQFHILSISHASPSTKMNLHSDSQRQITIHLAQELGSLSSSFTKWIGAQKIYVEAIDKWLCKCVSLTQNPSKRKRRMRPTSLRDCGPPIYMICGAWLEMIDELPRNGVAYSIRELAAQLAQFLPHQDKNQGKAGTEADPSIDDTLRYEVSLDRFRTSLVGFLGQLNSFAECSLQMFIHLQKAIRDAKANYEQFTMQRSQRLV